MTANPIARRRKGPLRSKGGSDGFTLIELLIAISIFTVGVLGVASMQMSAIRGNDFANEQTEAVTAGMDRVEKLLRLTYDHADLRAGDHTDPGAPAGYAVGWNVTDNSPLNNTKTIAVTVSWSDRGTQKSLSLRRIVPRII